MYDKPALRRLRSEDLKFKFNLDEILKKKKYINNKNYVKTIHVTRV